MTYKQALAKAFSETIEYATACDDQMGASEIDAFVKLHIEDFQAMVIDFVAERI